jgi:hypothetical protein
MEIQIIISLLIEEITYNMCIIIMMIILITKLIRIGTIQENLVEDLVAHPEDLVAVLVEVLGEVDEVVEVGEVEI